MVLVLGILGSPRRGGNSEILLDRALAGAADAGAEIERLHPASLRIAGCTECNDCYALGECSTADDMDRVYAALERADRIVVASPIFFMSFPAQLKAVIDRTQKYWALRYILREPFPRPAGSPPRYGAYIGVGATKGKTLFDGARLTLKYFFDAIAVEPREELYVLVRGIDEQGEIREREQALEDAYRTGAALARL
ncbi:MAG: flavodoxin family protein [Thermoleophilia bacterium]